MASKGLRQILDSFSLASSSRSFRSATVVEVDGTTKGNVASISEGRDDESRRVTKVLVIVRHITIRDLNQNITVFPVVSELREPGEVLRRRDSLLEQLVLDDLFRVHIEHNEGLKRASLQLSDVLTHQTD